MKKRSMAKVKKNKISDAPSCAESGKTPLWSGRWGGCVANGVAKSVTFWGADGCKMAEIAYLYIRKKSEQMKKLVLLAMAMMTMASVEAQEPQRLLTMEEAVLGTGLAVENLRCTWRANSASYSVVDQGVIYEVDPKTGARQELTTLEKINALLGTSLKYMPAYQMTGRGTMRFHTGKELVGIEPLRDSIVHRYAPPAGAEQARYADEGRFLYNRGGDLYWSDRAGEEHRITHYNDPAMVCGQVVSRNEFGITEGWLLAPDKMKVAFYRKDESRVSKFPLLDVTTRTGSLVEIRYPMAGMASERVWVDIYDFESDRTVTLQVTDFDEERYLTNWSFSPDSKRIYVQVVARSQKEMRLNEYAVEDGRFLRTILEERNDRFVEPLHPISFLKEDPDAFLYTTSNRDGYRNIYRGSFAKGTLERLTKVDADVELVQVNGRYLYYTSAEVSPVENHLFRLDLKTGKSRRLTPDEGWHYCSLSPDGRYFIDNYSSLKVPRVVRLASTDGKLERELLRAADPSAALNYGEIELGTVKSADGQYDNYYRLIKPHDFDPSKKYPVILYVYGGPHSQMVQNVFQAQLRRWEMLMAQRGYVVFVMDNRGTSNRGLSYEQAIYGQCGKCEMADQVAGLEWLLAHAWCDRDRVGVHGWSYGGFMTISLMTNYPDLFKVGVAGGPVIDWKWYEVMYGERYMGQPDQNVEGYAATSLIPMAAQLKGKLLICQGAIDPVVVWQHSLNFVKACIDHGVQVDYFPYPTHEHNVRGKDRVHLMQKVTDYFADYL